MPFVKGVVPFLKGDGQLVKGADRLKLLSKLAVFPLLLILSTCVGFFSRKWKFETANGHAPPNFHIPREFVNLGELEI